MLNLRALTKQERDRAFVRSYSKVDLGEHIAAVKQMQPGIAYAVTPVGNSARSERIRFSKAAAKAGVKLRFAKQPKDAKTVVLELA